MNKQLSTFFCIPVTALVCAIALAGCDDEKTSTSDGGTPPPIDGGQVPIPDSGVDGGIPAAYHDHIIADIDGLTVMNSV